MSNQPTNSIEILFHRFGLVLFVFTASSLPLFKTEEIFPHTTDHFMAPDAGYDQHKITYLTSSVIMKGAIELIPLVCVGRKEMSSELCDLTSGRNSEHKL